MSDEERKGTILESVKNGVTVYELRQDGDYYKLYMQDAIDNHEEEMGLMVCQAREEFGIHFTNH